MAGRLSRDWPAPVRTRGRRRNRGPIRVRPPDRRHGPEAGGSGPGESLAGMTAPGLAWLSLGFAVRGLCGGGRVARWPQVLHAVASVPCWRCDRFLVSGSRPGAFGSRHFEVWQLQK